jgi:hypothetical protein
MMTRAERSARNKAAHAIRRRMTDEDARRAKVEGLSIAWREIADTYAAMSTDDVLAAFGDADETPATVELAPKVKRHAPAHIQAAQVEYRLARETWQAGLDAAVAGGRTRAHGGKPARGERYTDEERDYRASNPAPVWKDFLVSMRGTVAGVAGDLEVIAASYGTDVAGMQATA